MASIITRRDGRRIIQVVRDNDRKYIHLGRCSKRAADIALSQVEALEEARRFSVPPDAETIEWLTTISARLYDAIHRAGLCATRNGRHQPRGDVMVYFFGCRTTDEVKIGISAVPKKRFLAIKSNYPGVLDLIGIIGGGREKEIALHRRFHEHHVRGEWFRWSKIAVEIDQIIKKSNPAKIASAAISDRIQL